jgi:hypothetical protein
MGPYLRGEKNKRTYNGFFCFQKNAIGEYFDRVRIRNWEKKAGVVREPEVREMDAAELKNKLFVFEQVADYDDYFGRLKEHRQQVKEILDSLIHPAIKKKLNQLEAPVIGVHVRMGDFRKLTTGEEYKSGHVRTPQAYFVKCIRKIRRMNGNCLPVTIFTDGYKEELQETLQLGNVKIIEKNPDLVDLLLLSRSKIILPTHGSTFSAWAAFLSEAPVVLPFDYQKPLREDELYNHVYEGVFDTDNPLLQENIKNINE